MSKQSCYSTLKCYSQASAPLAPLLNYIVFHSSEPSQTGLQQHLSLCTSRTKAGLRRTRGLEHWMYICLSTYCSHSSQLVEVVEGTNRLDILCPHLPHLRLDAPLLTPALFNCIYRKHTFWFHCWYWFLCFWQMFCAPMDMFKEGESGSSSQELFTTKRLQM